MERRKKLELAIERIKVYYSDSSKTLPFHDLDHALQVQSMVEQIGREEGIGEEDLLLIQIAALYHDVGYSDGPKGHEARGANIAREQLADLLDQDELDALQRLILCTSHEEQPQSLAEQVICDADLSYLGTDEYHERSDRLRKEMEGREISFSDEEWLRFNLAFFEKHKFYTDAACAGFGCKKENHQVEMIERLESMKS